jgi:hypothetical protein
VVLASAARPAPSRRTSRRPVLRLLTRPVTREDLLESWTRALDAAARAVESAYKLKAFDTVELKKARRRLRAERDWVEQFRTCIADQQKHLVQFGEGTDALGVAARDDLAEKGGVPWLR